MPSCTTTTRDVHVSGQQKGNAASNLIAFFSLSLATVPPHWHIFVAARRLIRRRVSNAIS